MIPVKICGITQREDAISAVQCGAVALGFIFYPPSPRYIKPEDAKIIISALPDNVVTLGVFVNDKPEAMKRILNYCNLDMIQMHGDESPNDCRHFPSQMLIKAVALKNESDLTRACAYPVAAILVDSRHAGLYGGTGKKANWDLANRMKEKRSLVLSGGLNAKNVTEAIKTVKPAALDINSGAEQSPGRKDHKKMEQIFKIIREAEPASDHLQTIFKKRNI